MTPRRCKKRIPLFDLKVTAAAKRRVAETLNSGWLTTGPRVAAFEAAVAERLKVKHVAAISSATAGMQLVLAALGVGPGRDVITTPFTFVATIEAILAVGARPILADIDPATYNIDPDEVARKLTDRTGAVMPVDIAGQPAPYKILGEMCSSRSVPLVSDSAHSFGASLGGYPVPKYTDASVYSFYSTKNLTCGEGGLVASRHRLLIEAVHLLARHGLTSDAHMRQQHGGWYYDAPTLGTKANMSDLHAAVGLGQLESFDSDQRRRAQLVSRYRRNLRGLSEYLELPPPRKGRTHTWHLLITKLHPEGLTIDRDRFIVALAEHGIECGVHYRPVFDLSFYRDALGLSPRHFPNTAYASRRVVSLPLYPSLRTADVDYVCACLRDVIKRNRR